MNIEKWLRENTSSLSGRLVAISGATGGIGRELCMYLGGLGADLVLINRNKDKSYALEKELKEVYPDISITHMWADFSDFDTVKALADELYRMPIDFLILNAGAYSIPRYVCKTGYDNVFQINFISPYYLARKLLPKIKERGGRIVAVGSIAHGYSKTNPEDVDFREQRRASIAYGNSKRYLTYSLLSLDGGEDCISITHPGITFTNITAHYPKLIFAIIKYPMKLIFMKPKTAALSVILGMFEPCQRFEWIGPALFDIWGLPKKKALRTAAAEEIRHIHDTSDSIYQKIQEL